MCVWLEIDFVVLTSASCDMRAACTGVKTAVGATGGDNKSQRMFKKKEKKTWRGVEFSIG